MPDLLTVIIRDRKGVVWEGEAAAVTGRNVKGPFDILPEHANFISIISKKLIIKTPDKKSREFNVESGILQVRENKVMIYLGVK
ncbi:MAG: H+transporting two-sector ATPase delta/epsilon subunit [Candidatus Amesbacteria bacterium GW2011_GWA1_46_35]|uniref:H+transporting two-sector ATPase delta/epsilon subunit n=1 Tax=Candidatus Amesbacteria bacterium GW2011_GWC2_45_19 TaxID=1618366 RepID=A0A0G1M3U4_9BACT|nr:MAG: H+transporting two-sector ATPase delta/epsilon subunit [Candidatus Amesbacteria bacterium GW2011_GWC2_45_19]KKU37628.1 MAG: H+transporting two-sector ATPase delta/epsilon subunit [Candidatus Amesbacteria bacterium GW2011_GWA1_46_35]KKU68478.1 MAG: H+transporting two-sector ATPase delta/epsilon subunit [Microgenomates group bacterium GW2011_GWC1_47_20]